MIWDVNSENMAVPMTPTLVQMINLATGHTMSVLIFVHHPPLHLNYLLEFNISTPLEIRDLA